MSPSASIIPVPNPPHQAGLPGLVAAATIGLQALGCAGLAVFFLLVASDRASLSVTSHLMFSLFTVLFAVGLGFVARGLWRGLSWPRTAPGVWVVLVLAVGGGVGQGDRGG